MISKKMRIRRFVLSVALLVVILATLKMLQPRGNGAAVDSLQPEYQNADMVQCDSCQGKSGNGCNASRCDCCGCKTR